MGADFKYHHDDNYDGQQWYYHGIYPRKRDDDPGD